jgi:glutathione S-transferase
MAPHGALEEAGADYRLVRVTRDNGRSDPPEFERLSPLGRVPVLVDGDLALTESAAIVMHISDRFPEARLGPEPGTPERARWYRWLVHLTNTVQPAFLRRLYPERYTADQAAAPALKESAGEELVALRDLIELHLGAAGPHLLGDRFTSADLYLHMLTRWGRHLDPKWWDLPALGAHYRLVGDRPAVRRMREQQGLDS